MIVPFPKNLDPIALHKESSANLNLFVQSYNIPTIASEQKCVQVQCAVREVSKCGV